MIKHPEFMIECCNVAQHFRSSTITIDEVLVPNRRAPAVFARNLYILFRLGEAKPVDIAEELGCISRTSCTKLEERTIDSDNEIIQEEYQRAISILDPIWKRVKSKQYFSFILDQLDNKQREDVLKEEYVRKTNELKDVVRDLFSEIKNIGGEISNVGHNWANVKLNNLLDTYHDKIKLGDSREHENSTA